MANNHGPQASLDLTHVLYDDSSYFSLALALLTLSPILLMPAYAVFAVQTREYLIIVMWLGQFAGEVLNLVLKHTIKQGRPSYSAANGYGFPSSHSQYMGYFASFLILHLWFRHRFSSTGSRLLDQAFRAVIYLALISWALVVAYSRYYLRYHSIAQILWGLGIGIALGTSCYGVCELIPRRRPKSIFGVVKMFAVENPVSTWLQIRDGWGVWADGGREVEWLRWRAEWDKRHAESSKKTA
ncbi:acidPPc domain-containing protein [Favolaschia claudopus]|uniref:Dolichyldiphosphatase n=1 Tax=Favolaschia claudopus TaxID=2862362 RepID=A0AAW0BHE9_9AGAR